VEIVGLPNVGKINFVNCLSNAESTSANFPFCTIRTKFWVISVPDERFEALGRLDSFQSEFYQPTIDIVDMQDW